ncbi:hypothetical protein, partial [Cellulomonas cellasea]|uniref:hypothetical protein n=1 Tax=Cellulomonas cellasea TaxID=43670 RepID=UPI0035316DCD
MTDATETVRTLPGWATVHGTLHGAETEALTLRVDQLEEALEIGGDRLDAEVSARVATSVARVRERL